MNETQGLGNTSYSISHKNVLRRKDRKRVAIQLTSILQHYFGKATFKNLRILDIGCSGGTITNYISNYSGKIVGIDVDKYAIKQAKKVYKNQKNLSFKIASGISLPFQSRSFDIVICNQVYSFASNPNKLMSEIYRALKKEGICLFTGDNLLYPVETLYNLPFIRWFPKDFVKYFLNKIGYKNYYIGKYKTYWGLKRMCNNFKIIDYTLEILINSEKYKFKKIKKYKKLVNRIPFLFIKLFEPFFPTFIFILQKK